MMNSILYVALVMAFIPFANGDKVGQVICAMATTQDTCNRTSASLDGACLFQAERCVFDPAITCIDDMEKMLRDAIDGIEKNCAAKLQNLSSVCSTECTDAALRLEIAGARLEGLTEAQAIERLTQAANSTNDDAPTKEYIACIGDMLGDVPAEVMSQSIASWTAFTRFQLYGQISCGAITADQVKSAYENTTTSDQPSAPNDASRISFSIVASAITAFVLFF